MQTFSNILKEINIQNKSLLTEESKAFGVSDNRLLESIGILSNNLILASLITEEISDADIAEIVNSIPSDVEELSDYRVNTNKNNDIIINWNGSKASIKIDDREINVLGVVNNPEALRGAVEAILQDYNPISEELTQDNVSTAIKSIPADTTKLTKKEIDVDGDTLSIDWNSETGSVEVSVNKTSVAIDDKAYDVDTLAELISKAVSSDPEETEEPITDPVIKKKLAVLKTIIKPKLIVPYSNSAADTTRIMNTLTNYIKTGSDENNVTGELDQRALVDFLLDLMNSISNNRNLASLVSKNATSTSVSESVISEASKKSKKKEKKDSDIIDVKLDMLLRLGLVDRKLYSRAKKALTNQKVAGSVPILRNLLFDILNSLITYIKKDPTLYNRIRINVMKEMAGMLPPSKAVREATQSGKTAAETEMKREVPEEYTNDHFTKEAWLHGYDSWDGIATIANEEDMAKTVKEFDESVSLSEISAITDVVNGLEVLSTSPFNALEEAEIEIKTLLSTIGLSFDKLTDGEIPLYSIEGGNAVLSVFSADDNAPSLEGDMILKTAISEGEPIGVTVSAEIIVYFEDGDTISLSDVDYAVETEDDEEPDMEDLDEEFESGKVFNVILFKPSTRSFLSSIIQAESIEEVQEIVALEMPMYVVHSINPIEVTDTTQY